MLSLYFGSASAIISTIQIIVFAVVLALAIRNNSRIQHWGRMTAFLLLFGISMSALSGMKDAVGTPEGLFPVGGFVFIAASVLGSIGVLVGLVTLFVRRQRFWQVAFYATAGIIILKVLLVEVARITAFLG